MTTIYGKYISDNTIPTSKYQDLSVTTAKINDDAITNDKIADNAVDSENIISGSIDETHLSISAQQSVLSSKYLIARNQKSDVTAPIGQSTMNIGAAIYSVFQSGRIGGTSSSQGVVITAPNNKVIIRNSSTNEPIEQLLTNRDVFGRITTDNIALTGTLDFTNGSAVISGSGTNFTSEVAVNDLIEGLNDIWYLVQSVDSDTQITLTVVYGGTTDSGSTNRDRLTLTFYVDNGTSEVTYNMGGQTFDFQFPEFFTLGNIPSNALVSGVAFADGLPATHTHDLSEVTDVTATASELNQVNDGVSVNVTATNLNTLTGGGNTTLHTHDGRYFTETELSSTSGVSGADLIGDDNSGRTILVGSTVGVNLDIVETKIGGNSFVVKYFTAENVTKGNSFVQTLDTAPAEPTKVAMFVGPLLQRYGAGHDFTISGTTVTLLSTADYDIEVTDEVSFRYFI